MTRTDYALAIKIARAIYADAHARRDAFDAELDADYPMPADDCDNATFDAWNDAYEDARCNRGGYSLDQECRNSEDAVLRACRAAMADRMAGTIADTAFAAALGEGAPSSFSLATRARVMALCLDLDVTTL
jgi:hypothetical protein